MTRIRLVFALFVFSSVLQAAPPGYAIVIQDQASLRAAPRASARQHAELRTGDTVEVRGERLDYLQVYDHRRERAGFVRASQVRRVTLRPEEAAELLSIVRFLRLVPGSEALGIAFAAAYIEAASAEVLGGDAGIEVLDALGTLADRLAHRSTPEGRQLEVVARYGVRYTNVEHGNRVHVCYDGDAFRRVLAMRSTPEQRARAALALTRPQCSASKPWSADVLDRVDVDALPGYLMNRVLMRRASIWSGIAYERARGGQPADAAASRAAAELARVDQGELAHGDARAYDEAAMRVGASRWAAAPKLPAKRSLFVVAVPGETGQTCVLLMGPRRGANPLMRRCTYGIVWTASAAANREGSALALAVQPTESWRELWLFHKSAKGWQLRVLPPAATAPGVGFAEFAGWRAGQRQLSVVRVAMSGGRPIRSTGNITF